MEMYKIPIIGLLGAYSLAHEQNTGIVFAAPILENSIFEKILNVDSPNQVYSIHPRIHIYPGTFTCPLGQFLLAHGHKIHVLQVWIV